MEPTQAAFDTFATWMLTRLLADLALGEGDFHDYLAGLYADMRGEPAAYGIPHEPWVPFFARVNLSPEVTAQHEALKAARMRVRKVVLAYPEFLFGLGKALGPGQCLTRVAFDQLAAEGQKKSRSKRFLQALERCGLAFEGSADGVTVSNRRWPGMPAELARLSQACAGVKEFDFYLFRRADAGALAGKRGPDFADVLRRVPAPFQAEVAATDERLRSLKYQREIFVDGGDMTYRVRYHLKGDTAVYWLRVQETFHADLGHYLRWKFDSDLTPRLFARLEELEAGLAGRVFAGLKDCAGCYGEGCLARGRVGWNGVEKDICKENGWIAIGYSRADYERLWTALGAFQDLVAKPARAK